MKKLFSILVAALLLSAVSYAQESHHWTSATVEELCKRLGEQGINAQGELALTALCTYASDPAHAAIRSDVREGLTKGIAAQADPVNRQFLLSQLRMVATPEDLPVFQNYVTDPIAGPLALRTLADLGGKDAILPLLEDESVPKADLANLVADFGWKEAEPTLLRWAAGSTDVAEQAALASALGRVGGEASLNWLKTHSLPDYLVALENLPAKQAVKAAKAVLKSGNSGEKCAAAQVILNKLPAQEGLRELRNLLKADYRPLRNTAIATATAAYGADAVEPVLTAAFPKLTEGAKVDVVNWLGAQLRGEQLVQAQVLAPGELGEAAAHSLSLFEQAQGFVTLFDGHDLSKWHGNLQSYTVEEDGTILVTDHEGATGNLYTNKEYRNFIYRFEFCFLEEGVNNGVGIRTPEGVDAAYDGMCELQILDHDAPQYAGWLKPYQVHGSIYGIVPAKRLKHKPLGEWSYEEIVVEGDHIKVTVNGQVITDADVREFMQGAPTIDGNAHPGLSNYKGFISFCGHGSGLKIRNVRIKDLGE